ncbi:MAG: hypothetical protein E7159_05380 [Firmicutes bacterium]|jgi:hypothetical protein|nr:hypothetical protein [Bacillota bacterium]
MTQKELLYLEDAYNHEKNIIDIYNNLEMEVVEDFMTKELKRHELMKNKIKKLLEMKAND